MQAILLAGGLGTRLRSVVSDRPKPMALIEGRPFMEYVTRELVRSGIDDIIFAVGYKGTMVEEYFGDGKRFGFCASYAYEETLLGTAGAIRNAGRYITEERFFVLNADTFYQIDYTRLKRLLDSLDLDMALVLREVPEEAFLAELPKVRAAAGDRAVNRAFHVYAENRRALAEKEALRQGDFDKFLALVRESGRSSAMYLQNVIPTGSTAAQELMVTIALCERILEGRGAVRVHGGGFGGTAQAFVPLDMLDTFKKATEAALGQDCCHVVMIRPAGGVRLG